MCRARESRGERCREFDSRHFSSPLLLCAKGSRFALNALSERRLNRSCHGVFCGRKERII